MKPCFGYIRVSTARQGDGASLEPQKDAITGFASQNNLTITKWFEERETAAKIGRPIFDAMLRALSRGDAEGIVIHKIDRSSRNYADWARLDDISRMGVKIFFAADSLDFDSRGGRLLADIQMALAADYSRNLSLEVKKGIYGRIKNGIYPFRAPLGYLDTGGGNPKAIDPVKGPLVKRVFDLYCSGEYSITSLTEEMRRQGLKGYGDRPVVRRNVESILKNPFYCGKFQVCSKLYQGSHEPLITATQFHRVAAIKAQRTQKKSTKHRMLFRGLVHCGECHAIFTGERQKGHRYYRCHTAGCANGSIREDRLEAQIVDRLRQLEIDPEDQAELEARMKTWLDDTGMRDMEKSIRLRLAEASSKQDRLTDLLVDGAISQTDYDLRKRNAEFDLQRLREELSAIENRRTAEQDLVELVALATDIASLFQAAPTTQRRELIRNCLRFPVVQRGEFFATSADWLSEIHKMKSDPAYAPNFDINPAVVYEAKRPLTEAKTQR
jgi:DNA invertase Pin-like site-specific DNA recombinase